MFVVAYLSIALALIAAAFAFFWRAAPDGARFSAARRTGEHWTERRTRQAKARAARQAVIYLPAAGIVLQGLVEYFK